MQTLKAAPKSRPNPAAKMLDSRQRAYLEAMHIPVWKLRVAAPAAAAAGALLKLGPGSGGVLLVCDADHESAGRLANDIARPLGGSPVWAWPVDDGEGVALDSAVEAQLFTTVAFFGAELARRFFAGEPPAHLRSAQVLILPAMREIAHNAGARKALWTGFCRSGMIEQG